MSSDLQTPPKPSLTMARYGLRSCTVMVKRVPVTVSPMKRIEEMRMTKMMREDTKSLIKMKHDRIFKVKGKWIESYIHHLIYLLALTFRNTTFNG